MSDKEFICTLCGEVWTTTLPEDAVRLTSFGGHRRSNVYRFADGTIHVIKAQSAGSKQ